MHNDSNTRQVVIQAVKRSGEETHHVQFVLDDTFAERLRQLRSLVPPLTSLTRQRDLVIDKVRVRLPNAIWRRSGGHDTQEPTLVDGSCLVIASEGLFNCGAKDRLAKEKLMTHSFPISRLLELHAKRTEGEPLFIRNGVFINDESVDSSAGRWVAALQDSETAPLPLSPSDFDTLPGPPLKTVGHAKAPGQHLN